MEEKINNILTKDNKLVQYVKTYVPTNELYNEKLLLNNKNSKSINLKNELKIKENILAYSILNKKLYTIYLFRFGIISCFSLVFTYALYKNYKNFISKSENKMKLKYILMNIAIGIYIYYNIKYFKNIFKYRYIKQITINKFDYNDISLTTFNNKVYNTSTKNIQLLESIYDVKIYDIKNKITFKIDPKYTSEDNEFLLNSLLGYKYKI